MTKDEIRRQELSNFLRTRRERLHPSAVGLLANRRRRTPGLRREEVAQLAGMSATWYTVGLSFGLCFHSVGPKPMLNRTTRMPNRRAAK